MKKAPLLALTLMATAMVYAQSSMVKITHIADKPYELQGGKVVSMYGVKLTSGSSDEISAQVGGESTKVIRTAESDSINIWLPTVGEPTAIKLSQGGKVIADQNYTPLVPSDWGYFKGGTIHIIQSSHQDIAWMNTPDSCREERINDIIIPALDMMKENKDFKFEMEQVLNLMEFIDAHPERKDEVLERYKEGRFTWGATFNQPYEGMNSGEQLVRQAYYGRKWVRENFPGADDLTANNMDVPGRTLQMPQILAKSGITNLYVSRMAEGLYDWYSPDGTSVTTISPGNYGWPSLIWKFFDTDGVKALNMLHHRTELWSDYYRERNIPPHYAILMSCDATKPTDHQNVIDDWNKIAELSGVDIPRIKSSSAEEYFDLVRGENSKFEEIHGERPDLWLYIHGPGHYQAINHMRRAAVSIPAAESFTTFASLLNNNLEEYPRRAFDRAWMASIYPDHGWGGKHGEITDGIFLDSLKTGDMLGESLLGSALDAITEKIDVKTGQWVVYNDRAHSRSERVDIESEFEYPVVKDDKGATLTSQSYIGKDGKCYVAFIAEDIPAMGYKSYSISKGKATSKGCSGACFSANRYQNSFYSVELGNGGIRSLFDKEIGKEIANTSKFAYGDVVEVGYIGNGAGEFTRIQDPTPGDISPLRDSETIWKVINSGDLFVTYQSETPTKNTTICQEITIYNTVKKIDFDVTLKDFNGEHNRQYRIAFPLNMMGERTINYEVPMGVATVGVSEMKQQPKGWSWGGTYVHHPSDTHPREVQNFMSASGNGFGLTMSSGVSVCDWIDPSREEAKYPVLQGILLSSHKSCHGLGNWYHQTGTHTFHFSTTSHDEGWQNGYIVGSTSNNPLRVAKKENKGGDLASTHSFLEISDPMTQLSLIKRADNDNSLIIRLTEMEGRDKSVTITLPVEVKKIIRTNLIEDEIEPISGSGREITIKLTHHAIETFKLLL